MPERIDNSAGINNINCKGATRRRFLGVLGIGAAAVAIVAGTGLLGRPKGNAGAADDDAFPGPGSIFHPARDPRTDPRR